VARKYRKTQGRRPEAQPAEASAPAAPLRARGATDFNPDYTHVRKDLKRIGFLAGFFILAMILGAILFR
jgi:hypothetical protein